MCAIVKPGRPSFDISPSLRASEARCYPACRCRGNPDFQAYSRFAAAPFANQAELAVRTRSRLPRHPVGVRAAHVRARGDEDGRVVEAFTPDFYLPEQDLYVEITVMKQSLVTRKNRKLRKLRERYPDVNAKLFYKRDIERLAERYRLDLASSVRTPRVGDVYLTREELDARVRSARRRAHARVRGANPLLVAPLKASLVFVTDLSRALTVAHELDFLELAGYDAARARASGCSRTSTPRSKAATC